MTESGSDHRPGHTREPVGKRIYGTSPNPGTGMAAMSTLDWLGLVGPYAVFFLMLIVYYVWEGRRERALRERYEEGEHAQ
ncbi:hypothetical protein JCM30237_13430 [Halolamina litorea]